MENKIYAEAFGIIGSLTDIKIDFISVDVIMDEAGAVVGESRKTEQRVALSIPLAKDLAKKLAAAVLDYEKNFGVVLDIDEVRMKAGETKTNE